MAWGVKYRMTFKDYFVGSSWQVDILAEDYSGAILDVVNGATPATINTLGQDDAGEGGIKAKECVLEFINTSSFQYLPIFTGTSRDYQAKIYKDSNLYFSGWVDPTYYQEEFISGKYTSAIHITDGLAELKNIDFPKPSSPGTFNKTLISIIASALGKTNLDLEIWFSTDLIFKDSEDLTINNLILEYLYLDYRCFRTGEDEWWSCYDVLDAIIKTFEGHQLTQENGVWRIERKGSMKTSQVDVNKYTSAGVFIASVKETKVQALTSNSVEQPVRFNSSAVLEVIPAWKKFNINQEFGTRENILDAFNLDGYFYNDEWEDDEDLIYWTRNGTSVKYISIRDDEDYSFRICLFTLNDPPSLEYLVSDTKTISGATKIDALVYSWNGYGNLKMKLHIDYKIKKFQYSSTGDVFKLYFQVVITDSLGDSYYSRNSDNGTTASFSTDGTNLITFDTPTVNKWTSLDIDLYPPRVHGTWAPNNISIALKIYAAYNNNAPDASFDEGLLIKNVKLGFDDGSEGTRNISNDINEKNRYVPSDRTLKIGESLGHWGDKLPWYGQEYMDRNIIFDAYGEYVREWGTKDAGIVGELVAGIMRSALHGKHALPLLKLTGNIRDNTGAIDFLYVIQDYSGNYYQLDGALFDIGVNEIHGEWVQIRVPEQGDGGEFNWDFSNDFNIGT